MFLKEWLGRRLRGTVMQDEMTHQGHTEIQSESGFLTPVQGSSRVFWTQVTQNPVQKGLCRKEIYWAKNPRVELVSGMS